MTQPNMTIPTTQPIAVMTRCIATGSTGKDAYGRQLPWTIKATTPDGKTITRHMRIKWKGTYMFMCSGKWHVRFAINQTFAQIEADWLNKTNADANAFAMTIQDNTNN